VKWFDCLKIGLVLLGLLVGPAVGGDQGPATEAFTFVQVCDTQLGMGGYDQDVIRFNQAVRVINALEIDFSVICGDLVHNYNDQSVADYLQIKSGLTTPCYHAAGNHDVGNTPTVSSLERYRADMGPDYFSFEHKGYTFVIANTSLWKAPVAGESETHDAWFRQTLEAARDKNSPIFIVQHYPVYVTRSDEADGYYNLPLAKRSELLALFEDCGVVAVLTGHRHELIIAEYQGIQLVTGETTSKNFDGRPFGFRLWHVDSPTSARHEFVALEPGLDFDSDGVINADDVVIMVDHWEQDYAPCDIAPSPYGDGIVDVQDLILLSEHLFEDYRLWGYWKLDETEGGIAHDDSVNHKDGTLHGSPAWRPAGGQVKGALEFDGIDDYISTPFVFDPADPEMSSGFSVFVWVKGGAPGQVILSQSGTPWGANWLRAGAADGSLITEFKGTGRFDRPLTSTSTITDGNWHRIGLVWDGSNRILYVDDAVVATDTQDTLGSSFGGLNIGAGKNPDTGTFWSGLIDDVRIYNRAVTP